MKHPLQGAALAACVFLSGCATYQAGSVSTGKPHKRFALFGPGQG